jgi:GAF domain-containing protein
VPRDGLELLGEPTDVPVGRRFVGQRLTAWGLSDLRDEVELAVTELLSNGLLHAGPPLRLHVEVADGVVRIEVHDTSAVPPVRPSAPSAGLTGRGLALVDALAERWGAVRTESGKSVWAELTAASVAAAVPHDDGYGGDPSGDPFGDASDESVDALLAAFDDQSGWPDALVPADGPGVPEHLEPRYTVVIGDVPTDLLVAAKAHIDGLVREFSLVSSGGAAGVSAPPPPALAALIDVVTKGFAAARAGIKRQASAAAASGEPRTTLRLTLPVSAAEAGERYLAALDAADAYARSARLLTLEEPPQHSAFRHWYVTSLAAALREAAGGPPAVHRTFEEFLLAEVDRLSGLRRAAERSARSQRVSATLTGATTAEQVGQAVLAEAVEALGATRGALLVPDPPGLVDMAELRSMRLAACHGTPPRPKQPSSPAGGSPTTPETSPAVAAMIRGEPIWVETAAERDALFPALGAEQPDIVALCSVPLLVGAKRLGALRLTFSEPRLFDSDERAFLTALAATTATSLDRARLFDAQRTLANRLARLQDISASLAAARTRDEVGDVVAARAADVLGATVGTLCLLTGHGTELEVVRSNGVDLDERWRRFPLDAALPASEAVRTNQPVLVRSVAERDRRYPGLIGVEPRDEHALICLPLSVGDRRLGAVTLTFPASRTVDDEEIGFLRSLATECAQALDRANALADARSASEKLAFLAAASAELARSLDYETTLGAVARLAVPRLADWVGVTVDRESARTLTMAHVDPARVAFAEELERRYPPDPAATTGVPNVLRTGRSELRPVITDEMLVAAARDEEHLRILRELGLSSAMVVPLLAQGRVLGAMQFVSSRSDRRYDAHDLALAEDLAHRAALAIENARNFRASADASLALQRSLLPTSFPEVAGLDLAWHYRPGTAGTQVGGDWFDVIPLPRNRVALVIGDVMGRGIGAAAVMGQLRTATRAYAALDLPPERILGLLDGLVQALDVPQIVTAVYAVYDPAGRELVLANAGHVPPIVLPPGARLPAAGRGPGPTGIPLGVGGVAYTAETVPLAPGTVLALYTDGLVETRERDVVDGIAVLTRVLARSGPELAGLADRTVEALTPPGGSDDDVALLLARTTLTPVVPSAAVPVGQPPAAVPGATAPRAVPATRTRTEP